MDSQTHKLPKQPKQSYLNALLNGIEGDQSLDVLNERLVSRKSDILELENKLEELRRYQEDDEDNFNFQIVSKDIRGNLSNREIIDEFTFRELVSILYPRDPDRKRIEMKKPVYPKVIGMFKTIIEKSFHNENKYFATFQLALHELRCENFEKADSLISTIKDKSLNDRYITIKYHRRYL